MKHTFKKENGHLIAEVSFDSDEIKTATDKAVNKLILNVTVPGFRKGKAPKDKAVRYLKNENVYNETVDALLRMVDKNFAALDEFKAEAEGKICNRARPDVALTKFDDKEADFTINWLLNPVVTKLGEYKGLTSDAKLREISDEDVDHQIHHLAEDNAELVESDKESALGDTCNIDFVGYMDGKPFEGGDGKGFDLELGSGRFVPGFEDQCVGHKAGDKFDVALTMPENYPAPLSAKPVVFKVTLNSVKVKEVPEINDDFATTLTGKFVSKDLAELKSKVHDDLTHNAEEAFKNSKINSYLLKVRDGSEFVIAKEYVDLFVKDRIASDEQNINRQGLTLDEYLKLTKTDKAAYEQNIRTGIENDIKTQLVYDALAKAENIAEPTNKDIEEQIGSPIQEFYTNYSNYLKSMKMPEDQINMQIQGYLNQVYASILTGKVQARILELNEKPAEEAKAE